MLPNDVVCLSASNRIVVGLSRLERTGLRYSWRPERVTRFTGRDHALRVLCASCHLPGLSGLLGKRVGKQR